MKKITVRLYNNRYAFEEVLQFNFEDQYEVQIYEDWLKCRIIHCMDGWNVMAKGQTC